MKIGYSVEGGTDRGLLKGLQIRWCPDAELLEGRFRGTSGQSQRREIPNTCVEIVFKGADIIVFLRDANDEQWRDVLKKDQDRCHSEHQHLTIFSVCDRNVECWLCADADWIAKETGKAPSDFRVPYPKRAFESALGISSFDRKEEEIAQLVTKAPLKNWLTNRSFEDFYNQLWQKSKEHGCSIENLRA
ncbi:MAG: hypothetical protein A2Z25_23615 [Planctomycetes bacterium RBG_16_55_9]|nr:MAG: hypothetical protein A2Z25_23615 [Planctomycetes bacterium RBG_16_55_9]